MSLPQIEQQYYAELYNFADKDRDGKISGLEGAIFLRTSGLSDKTLEQIWNLADQNRLGYLSQKEFAITMRLVSLAQQGQEVSLQKIHDVSVLPKFQNIPVPSYFSEIITDEDIAKYDALFTQADQNRDGFVDGNEAKNYLSKSQLDQSSLAKIWGLSELDGDAKLNKGEFRIAMHLIYWALRGNELPTSLPPSFVLKCCQTVIPTSQPPQIQVQQHNSAKNLPVPSQSSFTKPSTQGDLTFVPVQSAHRHDESRLTNQYALSGASFETRANLSNELSEKINERNRSKSKGSTTDPF